MVTHVSTEADLDELVEDLIELDFAAIEAYDAAIDRLSNYERAVNHEDVDDDLRGVFEKNLSDERRHRAWIESTLASL